MKIFRTQYENIDILANLILREALDVSLRFRIDIDHNVVIEISGSVAEVRRLEELYRKEA